MQRRTHRIGAQAIKPFWAYSQEYEVKKMRCWIKAMVTALILTVTLFSQPAWGFMLLNGFKPAVSKNEPVTESGLKAYEVKKGDTVWSIAHRENLDPEVVMAINNLGDKSILSEGQILNIPYRALRIHVVVKGDTLWEIASRYQVSVEDLVRENNIRRPEALQIGQRIVIPGSSTAGRLWRSSVMETSRFRMGKYIWPTMGTITCPFGWRKHSFHHGIDIAVPLNTPIRAAASGVVVFAGYKSVYGRTVMIEHGNGQITLYGHINKILVHEGQHVCRGQVIAKSGSTGRSTGPHVHFEVRNGDKAVNPLKYLR